MPRLLLLSFVFVLACGFPAHAQQPGARIPLSQIEQMFAQMRSAGVPVSGDLLWGYFFVDSGSERLQKLAAGLKGKGYRQVGGIRRDPAGAYRLHVERVETHTPASLHKRNQEFYRLASEAGIQSYDGMDVGRAPKRR